MSKRKKNIEEFFNAYESHFNNAISSGQINPDDIRESFADCFIESSPLGVNCGKNDSGFLDKITQGLDFYKGIGTQAMNIVAKDVTLLDDFHAMVKIYWRYTYLKDNNKGAIDFNVFYFVNTVQNNQVKIFAYIAGDEQKALKERGLVPEEEIVSNN
jgi:hypothetical protein